ncbi:MAG: hypothetical protein ABJY83_19635 [Roseibium sp.]
MIEPKSTATIRALASLAELSADQLEKGSSVEDVIQTLRKAAEAVRLVVEDVDDEDDFEDEETDLEQGLEQDLAPMELVVSNPDSEDLSEMIGPVELSAGESEDTPVLNAG